MSKPIKVVNTLPLLKSLLDKLETIPVKPPPRDAPSLYFDIEGVNLLGRHGSISIMTLIFLPDDTIYLIDVLTLGHATFTTKSFGENCLGSILESPDIPKVFFDVRNDSYALFSLYGISLAGVQDLQLMEIMANVKVYYPSEYVSGLARCIQRDLPANDNSKRHWLRLKEDAKKTFDTKSYGNLSLFKQRPLQPEIVKYCEGDVTCMPNLWMVYSSEICKPNESGFFRHMVRTYTTKRIKLSQSQGYDSQAKDKVWGPWSSEVYDDELENWNDDVIMLGVNDKCTLKELSFGIFMWV